jgi:hypothetical protein
VAEAVAALGGFDHEGSDRFLELGIGLVLGPVGDGQQLVGPEGQAQQRHPAERAHGARGKGRRHRTIASVADPRHLEHGERESGRRVGDLLDRGGVEVREPVGEKAVGRGRGQRAEHDPLPAATGDQAGDEVLEVGRCGLAVRQHEDDAFVDRTAREVVQETQRGLVGVLQVVDHQQQSGTRPGDPHELGGRDEESLVAGLACPAEVAPREGALDLDPVVVAQGVEQRRVSAAQATQRLQHG